LVEWQINGGDEFHLIRFYEWKKRPKKQPYYIHFEDGRPLVFAALYDSWENAEGEFSLFSPFPTTMV